MSTALQTKETLSSLKRKIDAAGHGAIPVRRHLSELALATVLSYGGALLMLVPEHPALWLLGLASSAFGFVALLTQGHTASHGVYTKRARWDQVVVNFCFPVSLGLSAVYWNYKHIRKHHHAPNVMDWDRDLDLDPPFTVLNLRYEAAPAWLRRFYRVQWLTLPIALMFTSFSAQKDGWRHLLRTSNKNAGSARIRRVDFVLLIVHLLVWLVLPALIWGPGTAIAGYLCRMVVTSYLIFCTFAPAHFPVEALALSRSFENHDFVERQAWTTLNFRTGPIGRFLCAGVEYQIEHHLIPRLSHTAYPRISGLVKDFCEQRGCPHRTLSWGRGIWLSLKAFHTFKVVQTQLPVRTTIPKTTILGRPRATFAPMPVPRSTPVGATIGGVS